MDRQRIDEFVYSNENGWISARWWTRSRLHDELGCSSSGKGMQAGLASYGEIL